MPSFNTYHSRSRARALLGRIRFSPWRVLPFVSTYTLLGSGLQSKEFLTASSKRYSNSVAICLLTSEDIYLYCVLICGRGGGGDFLNILNVLIHADLLLTWEGAIVVLSGNLVSSHGAVLFLFYLSLVEINSI